MRYPPSCKGLDQLYYYEENTSNLNQLATGCIQKLPVLIEWYTRLPKPSVYLMTVAMAVGVMSDVAMNCNVNCFMC